MVIEVATVTELTHQDRDLSLVAPNSKSLLIATVTVSVTITEPTKQLPLKDSRTDRFEQTVTEEPNRYLVNSYRLL